MVKGRREDLRKPAKSTETRPISYSEPTKDQLEFHWPPFVYVYLCPTDSLQPAICHSLLHLPFSLSYAGLCSVTQPLPGPAESPQVFQMENLMPVLSGGAGLSLMKG